jgi:hypothetical protein
MGKMKTILARAFHSVENSHPSIQEFSFINDYIYKTTPVTDFASGSCYFREITMLALLCELNEFGNSGLSIQIGLLTSFKLGTRVFHRIFSI